VNIWVIEGDDHEQRIIVANSESAAIEQAQADFEDQYGEPYGTDLLTVRGLFATEDGALAAFPEALS